MNTDPNDCVYVLELDAFLVTACSPELLDSEGLARLKLDLLTPRGVQLATLFMQVSSAHNTHVPYCGKIEKSTFLMSS
jgi:hypothetical protein